MLNGLSLSISEANNNVNCINITTEKMSEHRKTSFSGLVKQFSPVQKNGIIVHQRIQFALILAPVRRVIMFSSSQFFFHGSRGFGLKLPFANNLPA